MFIFLTNSNINETFHNNNICRFETGGMVDDMGLELINQLRKKKRLTSERLSELSGVPLGTLNKILNGATKNPKLETLKALAKVLDCRLDDFQADAASLEKTELVHKIVFLNDIGCKVASAYVDGLLSHEDYTQMRFEK